MNQPTIGVWSHLNHSHVKITSLIRLIATSHMIVSFRHKHTGYSGNNLVSLSDLKVV